MNSITRFELINEIERLERSIYMNEQCNNTYGISGGKAQDFNRLSKMKNLLTNPDIVVNTDNEVIYYYEGEL